jgi:hypothetical protein
VNAIVTTEAGVVPSALSHPRPAVREASRAATREDLSHLQRRLPLGYSDPSTPIQAITGSGVEAVRPEGSHEQKKDFGLVLDA